MRSGGADRTGGRRLAALVLAAAALALAACGGEAEVADAPNNTTGDSAKVSAALGSRAEGGGAGNGAAPGAIRTPWPGSSTRSGWPWRETVAPPPIT